MLKSKFDIHCVHDLNKEVEISEKFITSGKRFLGLYASSASTYHLC